MIIILIIFIVPNGSFSIKGNEGEVKDLTKNPRVKNLIIIKKVKKF
jgi:hypothetical protein